ncbi:Aspartic peptidase domain superfamily [Sesbania bispinosa]|nr:Aspartic peptidase domain superfamily [Sesbania bispinosa]
MRLARNVELAIKKGVGPHVRSSAQRGFTARDGSLLLQSFKPSSQTSTWNRSNRDSSYSPKQDWRVGGATSETPKQPVSGARGVRVVLLGEDEMTNEEGEVLVAEEMNPKLKMIQKKGSAGCWKGVCQKIKVDIGGYGCLIDAYVLGIGGLDLILGVAWLRTLGAVIANWEKMTMSFQVSGQNFTLEGAVKPNQVVSSLHSIIHNPYFGSIQPDRKKGNREVRGTQTLTI